MNTSSAHPPHRASREYLLELIHERDQLRGMESMRHATKKLDTEIKRVLAALSSEVSDKSDVSSKSDEPRTVSLQEKIPVPVDKYPTYNFVGRILGPRGMTAKQLEEETGCKIMVRGRGVPQTEPLHVVVHCEDTEDRVEAKLQRAVQKIKELLTPPPEGKDILKREQLIQLAIINGNLRPTSATKIALQTPSYARSPSASSNLGVSSHYGSFLSSPSAQYPPSAIDNSALLSILTAGERASAAEFPGRPLEQPLGNSNPYNLDDDQARLAALIASKHYELFLPNSAVTTASSTNNPFADFYIKQLRAALADPNLLSCLVSGSALSTAPPPVSPLPNIFATNTNHANASSAVREASLQQYLTAAAMLNLPSPYTSAAGAISSRPAPKPLIRRHDGSGDTDTSHF